MSKHFVVSRAPKTKEFKPPLSEADKLERLRVQTEREKAHRMIRVFANEMPKRVKGRSKRGWTTPK